MPETRVLGIEGTAWNFSAAVFDEDLVCLHSSPYVPPHGGIHPREAAQHHAAVAAEVIGKVLAEAGDEIDGVAFSIGPGLGPSLRPVATAARALVRCTVNRCESLCRTCGDRPLVHEIL